MDLSFLKFNFVGWNFLHNFYSAVIKPITKMFVEKINTQIRDLKKFRRGKKVKR